MIRGLFFCAIACGVAVPSLAGERSAAAPRLAGFTAILPVADRFPGYDGALTISGDVVVRLRSAPLPTVALADFENRTDHHFDIAPDEAPSAEPAVLVSSHGAVDWRALKAWRLTERPAPTTPSANGFYAVRDLLADYRKPRAFRPSALSAMLVLRIDGKDDSPPLSVGGGGVAAALWRAVPQ